MGRGGGRRVAAGEVEEGVAEHLPGVMGGMGGVVHRYAPEAVAPALPALESLIADKPEHWATSYNAGCFEALAGDADAAFEHLHRAKELDADGESGQYFREDGDLDPIRDDPRFQELLA